MNIDTLLKDRWNSFSSLEIIHEENCWDLCRQLEEAHYLEGSLTSISAISVGPFKIASNLDLRRRDYITFFITTVIPMFFEDFSNYSYEKLYSTILKPLIAAVIILLDATCLIDDELCWKIILFVKRENVNNCYPTENDIFMDKMFKGYETEQIEEACKILMNYSNLLGGTKKLLSRDNDGRYTSLV